MNPEAPRQLVRQHVRHQINLAYDNNN